MSRLGMILFMTGAVVSAQTAEARQAAQQAVSGRGHRSQRPQIRAWVER